MLHTQDGRWSEMATESKVVLSVDKDGLTGGFQLSIGDDRTGYRIAGPKYCGQSKSVFEHRITPRDAGEIHSYIRELLPENEPHEIFYMQLADDGTAIRKWSR